MCSKTTAPEGSIFVGPVLKELVELSSSLTNVSTRADLFAIQIGQINVTSEKTREIAGRQKGCLVSYTYSEESSPTCALSSIAFYLLNNVL